MRLEELETVMDLVPADRMSDAARQFAKRLLRHDAERLLSHPFGTVKR